MKFYHNFRHWLSSHRLRFKTKLGLAFHSKKLVLSRQTIMRINLVFLITLTAIMQVSASSYGQKININEKNTSLTNVLRAIRAQSGYDVLFDAKVIQNAGHIDLYVKDASIEEALNKCLSGLNLTFSLQENTVIIREKSLIEKIGDEISYRLAVNEIIGYVYMNNGSEVLVGANVKVKRTKKAVLTDSKGRFTMKDVLSTDTLEVSFIGYKTATYVVGKNTSLYITLVEAVNPLDILVIQGYGNTSKRLATGNITRVGADQIGKQLVDNPILALQGSVPGLEITMVDGQAFASQKIEIRGRKSINANFSSEPLIIIDGVPQTVLNQIPGNSGNTPESTVQTGLLVSGSAPANSYSPLYNVNPSDIESIEVLKDADATAIYGSRAGNGVILITTKKGKAGKTQFNVRLNQGIKSVINKWDLLNTEEYLNMRREAFRNDGITPTVFNAPELLVYEQDRYTDWQEFAYGKTGAWTDANLNLVGGDASTTFRVGASLNNTKDITDYSGINRKVSANMSLSHSALSNKLKIQVSGSFNNAKNTMVRVGSIHMIAPNAPAIFNETGGLNFSEWGNTMTEFADLLRETELNNTGINASANVQYSPSSNFNIKINGGYGDMALKSRYKTPRSTFNLQQNPTAESQLTLSAGGANNVIVEPQIDYNIAIGGGRLTALVGASYQSNRSISNLTRAVNFPSDDHMNSINFASKYTVTEWIYMHKYAGVFARLNYNFNSKYIINLNARRDGSSKFGTDYRFGNFGSVGAAWILSEENFIKRNLPRAISFLKLRGSYGVVGSDGIGDYKYLTQWGISDGLTPKIPNYDDGGAILPMLLPNSEFRWQNNIKSELGINVGLFKDAVNFGINYYSDFTNNQLLSFPVPLYTGFGSLVLNSPAEVRNSGLEFDLSARILDHKKFKWSASFNISKNKNTLTNYPDFENSPYYNVYKIGQPLTNIYVLKNLGVDAQTGTYKFLDADGDGKVQQLYNVAAGTHGDDRVVAVDTSPEFSGGMNHSFSYKNLQVSANFGFKKGKGRYYPTPNGNKNMTRFAYDNTWHKPGDETKFAKLTSVYTSLVPSSTLVYTDVDFIRLRNVQLAYRVASKKLKNLGVSDLAINATAQNLFVLTKFKGLDPELLSESSVPQTRIVTMGLNLTF